MTLDNLERLWTQFIHAWILYKEPDPLVLPPSDNELIDVRDTNTLNVSVKIRDYQLLTESNRSLFGGLNHMNERFKPDLSETHDLEWLWHQPGVCFVVL